jgi:hypothetical protein
MASGLVSTAELAAAVGSAIVSLIARNLGAGGGRDTAKAVACFVRTMKKQTLPQGPRP